MHVTIKNTIDFCPIILCNLKKLIAWLHYIENTFAVVGRNISIQTTTSVANLMIISITVVRPPGSYLCTLKIYCS